MCGATKPETISLAQATDEARNEVIAAARRLSFIDSVAQESALSLLTEIYQTVYAKALTHEEFANIINNAIHQRGNILSNVYRGYSALENIGVFKDDRSAPEIIRVLDLIVHNLADADETDDKFVVYNLKLSEVVMALRWSSTPEGRSGHDLVDNGVGPWERLYDRLTKFEAETSFEGKLRVARKTQQAQEGA